MTKRSSCTGPLASGHLDDPRAAQPASALPFTRLRDLARHGALAVLLSAVLSHAPALANTPASQVSFVPALVLPGDVGLPGSGPVRLLTTRVVDDDEMQPAPQVWTLVPLIRADPSADGSQIVFEGRTRTGSSMSVIVATADGTPLDVFDIESPDSFARILRVTRDEAGALASIAMELEVRLDADVWLEGSILWNTIVGASEPSDRPEAQPANVVAGAVLVLGAVRDSMGDRRVVPQQQWSTERTVSPGEALDELAPDVALLEGLADRAERPDPEPHTEVVDAKRTGRPRASSSLSPSPSPSPRPSPQPSPSPAMERPRSPGTPSEAPPVSSALRPAQPRTQDSLRPGVHSWPEHAADVGRGTDLRPIPRRASPASVRARVAPTPAVLAGAAPPRSVHARKRTDRPPRPAHETTGPATPLAITHRPAVAYTSAAAQGSPPGTTPDRLDDHGGALAEPVRELWLSLLDLLATLGQRVSAALASLLESDT